MSDDHRKKIARHPALTVQYHPAAAVRARGDEWMMGRECWNVSSQTFCALRELTEDANEFTSMCMMERGERGRV